jgi:RHS repeat-associated protein
VWLAADRLVQPEIGRQVGMSRQSVVSWRVWYSRDPAGSLIGVKTGASGVLAWTDLHTDVVGQFTTTGTSLAGSTTYGPLGTIAATSGMTGNLGYQSGFTEFNTSRVNMAARRYNPASGQFDNRDSVANPASPNSANADRYAYANDNPLTTTDPTSFTEVTSGGGLPRLTRDASVDDTAPARMSLDRPVGGPNQNTFSGSASRTQRTKRLLTLG